MQQDSSFFGPQTLLCTTQALGYGREMEQFDYVNCSVQYGVFHEAGQHSGSYTP